MAIFNKVFKNKIIKGKKTEKKKDKKVPNNQTLYSIKNTGIHSIRVKLISAFLILIIPIVLLGVVSHQLTSNTIVDITQSSTIETMKQTNKYISLILQTVEETSLQIFSNSMLQDLFSADLNNLSYEEMKRKQDAALTFQTLCKVVILFLELHY